MKAAIAFLTVGLMFGSPAWAHPGSGLAVDAQGRVFFTAGPMIVMIETNGVARTIVHDAKNEKFYRLNFPSCVNRQMALPTSDAVSQQPSGARWR